MMASFRAADRIVYILRRDTHCGRCNRELGTHQFVCLTGGEALCLECAGLTHLEYLPARDTAVTRRATKHSALHVVVMKKSPARKRSERQGILAKPEAKRRAKEDQVYIAAFAKTLRKQFPRCPQQDAHEIAAHACQKYSGRVGRSATAKQLEPQAIRLAVIAHFRHKYTQYDRLLARYDDRYLARSQVQGRIEQVLIRWERPSKG